MLGKDKKTFSTLRVQRFLSPKRPRLLVLTAGLCCLPGTERAGGLAGNAGTRHEVKQEPNLQGAMFITWFWGDARLALRVYHRA